MGRAAVFLAGLGLAVAGWATLDPNLLSAAFRPLLAIALLVFAAALILGSLVGHRRPAPQASLAAPAAVDAEPVASEPDPFPAEPHTAEAEPETDPAPFPVAEAIDPETAAEPLPEPELVPAAAPAEPSAPAQSEVFAAARDELRSLARQENWSAAGALLGRLPRLAATDTEHALAAQDLGTFHRSQGKTDEAAEAYETALSYARESADPELLAAALTDVGDVAHDQRRLDAALTAYTELVDLRRQGLAADASPEARRRLSLALERLGDAREDRGQRTRALVHYRESMAIAGELAAADPAKYGPELAVARQRVAELEAHLEM